MYNREKKVNIDFLKKRLSTDLNPIFTENLIQERIETSKKNLTDFISNNLGNDSELLNLVERITLDGNDAMKALFDEDSKYLQTNRKKLENLEIIVQTDGSRPSFLVKDNNLDESSSPITDWGEMIKARKDLLVFAISCVGRIDAFGGTKIGTGFLISKNLILTNRHVLESISNNNPKDWNIYDGCYIDFGGEYRGIKSVNRSKLKSLIFCGEKPINGILDHKNLDIALIEIESLEGIDNFLPINMNTDWANDEQTIFTIGFPTSYVGYSYTLLDLLFKSQFGFKRISPGRIHSINNSYPSWTFSHDATTLGGNSGSVVILLNEEKVSAGIHYGGTKSPLSNWGHIIGATMGARFKGKTFREILSQNNITTINS